METTLPKVKRSRPNYVKHREGGVNRSSEYNTLACMIQRCQNPKHDCYPHYGGRGIKICEEWNCVSKFPAFLAYMGRKPSPKHTIERIDNNGNYEPGNVRWATKKEQLSNRRNTVLLTFRGESLCRNDMARRHGLTPDQLRKRLRTGWDLERALTEPISQRHVTWRKEAA